MHSEHYTMRSCRATFKYCIRCKSIET
jgi:hypothetical protein